MSSTTLLRWSGLALLIAGVFIAVAFPFHPSDTDPQALARPAWMIVHSVFSIAFLLGLFGLIGLYSQLRESSGWLGLTGFVLLFLGNALFASATLFEAFTLTALFSTAAGQTMLDPAGPLLGGPLNVVFLLTSSVFSLGCILLSIALLRSKMPARWAGLLLLAGPLPAFIPPVPFLLGTIGGILFGLGYIWLGYALFARMGEQTILAQVRTQ